MRILHVTQRYWPAMGGSELHMAELSRRLAADGHAVTVATTDALDFELFWDPRRRRVAQANDMVDGVQVLRFPVRHLPLPQLAYPAWRRMLWLLTRTAFPPTSWVTALSRLTPYVPDLWRWLATTTEPFDLVAGMTICFEPLLAAGLTFARRRKLPFVAYPLTHLGAGSAPASDAISRFYTMRHQVDIVRRSDAVIAQTATEQRYYVAQGVPTQRITVAGPGIDPAQVTGGNAEEFRARFAIRGPLVACIGSMSADKGTTHLVEAVRRLWQDGVPVHLVLAGALLTPFQHFLDRLPAQDRQRLHVLGSIDEETKQNLLAAATVFAMPSRTDSFGIAYLEAWLYRKPVIGAQTWGIDDVITHGSDGLLAPFGDVSTLAAALHLLITQPALARAMGDAGRTKVLARHTWDHKYALTRQVYAQLVARGAV